MNGNVIKKFTEEKGGEEDEKTFPVIGKNGYYPGFQFLAWMRFY